MTALPPDELARRLADVYAVLGPLYRRATALVDQAEGVPVGVRAVLEVLLVHEGLTVPRIAEALAVSRQFAQRMVNAALDEGLVVLRPNPAHRRSSLVALTRAGRERIDAIRRGEHEAMRTVGGGELTAEDLDACLRVLRAMHDGLR